MFRTTLLSLPLLALCAPASAQTPAPLEVRWDTQTTLGMVDCLGARTKTWDKRLNLAYQALTQRSDPGQQQPFSADRGLFKRSRTSRMQELTHELAVLRAAQKG
jgi:uncharacterized protein YecT (DUF1311 family)